MSEADEKRVRVLVRLKHSLKEGEEIHAILPQSLAEFEEMSPGFTARLEQTEGPGALAAWKRRRRSLGRNRRHESFSRLVAMSDGTLDELDPPAWADAADDDTFLVRRCHELRKKPISEFTVEDLRITIGQQIGLPHLVSRALSVLAVDPLASGDMFPGDLLEAVMRIDVAYWADQPDQLETLRGIVNTLAPMDPDVRAAVAAFQLKHA